MKPTEHLTITERPGTYITVMSDSSGPIIVVSDGPGARASRYTPEEAAKLGLAVLEAAGVESPYYNLKDAVDNLRQHVEREAQHAAEAKAQAELEAEALELFNVVREHDGEPRVATWDGFHAGTMEVYLLLARRARELAKEATK